MKKIITIVLWTVVILWMVMIFMFSAENAEESTKTSDGIVDIVVDHVLADKKESMSISDFQRVKYEISLLVRKSAHFFMYTVLGMLVMCAVSRHTTHCILRPVISLSVCVLYAISDEIHQLFVPGRAGRVLDVFIDSSGTLTGIAIVFLIMTLINKIINSKKEKAPL